MTMIRVSYSFEDDDLDEAIRMIVQEIRNNYHGRDEESGARSESQEGATEEEDDQPDLFGSW